MKKLVLILLVAMFQMATGFYLGRINERKLEASVPEQDAGVIVVMLNHEIEGFIFISDRGKEVTLARDDCDSDCISHAKALQDSGNLDTIDIQTASGPST